MSNAASRDAPPGNYVANHTVGTLALRVDCRHAKCWIDERLARSPAEVIEISIGNASAVPQDLGRIDP